jgi:hypothetical protein
MLAGEPLLALDGVNALQDRTKDLELLHHALDQGKWEVLSKTQGVFCAVQYKPAEGILTLIADKLCIRPLYYWVGEQYVVFASSMRILEALPMVPKVMDLRAVAEIASLGYPLGTRTPYAGISLLKAAEIIQFSEDKVSRFQYWRWDQIPKSKETESELLLQAYDKFTMSIARRIRSDRATVAFLSGGLDSRCIVELLRKRGVTVHTFNFSHPNTQDHFFGTEFAHQVGTIHTQASTEIGPTLSTMMSAAWNESKYRATYPVERPQLVWSGDGGSVGVGHVYLTQVIVDLMRDRELDDAVKAFLNQQKAVVVKGLLKASIANYLSEILEQGIREELDDIHSDDPGRDFHIFLLLNDQRRHLTAHFEDIDLHRIEFHLPFFDSNFLSSILAVPIDQCLGHRLYTKWLNYFPSAVTSVPWQAYPGHEPCPLPIPKELLYQWQPGHFKSLHRMKKHRLLQQADELIKAKHFPHEIMSKKKLRLATWIYRIGLRDYGYVINTAETFYKYWALCKGNTILPN